MFFRKYFAANFTFNGSAGMNSAYVKPYTSKSYIKD